MVKNPRVHIEGYDLSGLTRVRLDNLTYSQRLKPPERVLGTHFWNPPHILP